VAELVPEIRVETVAPGGTVTVKLVVDSLSEQITGDVKTADGKPIADAYVVAYPGGDFTSVWRWTWGERPVLTATDGTFTIKKLAPGSYTVHAYRKGGGETFVQHVATGSTLHLQIAPTATLAGTATFADGTHPDFMTIWVRQQATGFGRIDHFENTAGAFTVTDVPPGELEVVARAPDALGKLTVTVAAGEQKTGVAIPVERLVPVTGRLVDASGHAMPGLVVLARNKRLPVGVVVSADEPNASGDDGRFKTLALPGDVTISVANPDMMDHTWCLPQMQKTITGPLDLGDLVIKKAPCH